MRAEAFFRELDGAWQPLGGEPLELRIIGAGALQLLYGYDRGTRDGDVLETDELTAPIKVRLSELAGEGSVLKTRHRMHLHFVPAGLPFLPPKPRFEPALPKLKLKNFRLSALHAADVAVSKLARFLAQDSTDIKAIVDKGLMTHAEFVARFRAAVDLHSMDARADKLPAYLERFHTVERDFFAVKPTAIALPDDE